MGKGDIKVDPLSIVRAHRKTYVNASTGRPSQMDRIVLEVAPVAFAAISLILDIKLKPGASIAMLTAAGILSALLFSLMLQVSERAISWADDAPKPGSETSRHAQYLLELAANSGYTSLIAVLLVCILVGASTTHGWALRILSALALATSAHLILLMLMIMKRVFVLTAERLRYARTGAGIS
jgi:hypothetical protein